MKLNDHSELSKRIDNLCSDYSKIDLENFQFLDPKILEDRDLRLELSATKPYNKMSGYVPTYEFNIVNNHNNVNMGGFRLRVGYNENIKYLGHMGANVDEGFRGNRYTTRCIKLLMPFVARHNINDIIITCNPDNIASIRTCENAGGKLLGILNIPSDSRLYSKDSKQKCIYHFNV